MMPKFLILSFLLAGCASSSVPYAFRPEGFTDQEIGLIQESADEWQMKSNGRYSVIVDENCPDDCSIIKKVEIIDGADTAIGSCLATVDHFGIRTHEACDEANPDHIQSFEIQLKYDYNVKYNSLHEFGHVFGKHHDPEPNNVMYADIEEQAQELTVRDLENPNY
jgi:hypothetical protein